METGGNEHYRIKSIRVLLSKSSSSLKLKKEINLYILSSELKVDNIQSCTSK